MLVFGSTQETLPITVELDPTSGLPLLEERHAILQYILAYLAVPYSIADYGCGKKVSLLIEQLLQLNIPAYALGRALIMEPDLSPEALKTHHWQRRKSALSVDNPLADKLDLQDPRLQSLLQEHCPQVEFKGEAVQVGDYSLTPQSRQSFEHCRSHVMAVISFWDRQQRRVTHQALDPSLKKDDVFPLEDSRELLHCPDALLFDAPLLGRFRLSFDFLTPGQVRRVESWLEDDETLSELSDERHNELVRHLTGAEKDSLGDPVTWSYANNARLPGDDSEEDHKYWQIQCQRTGDGEPLRGLRQKLFHEREARGNRASEYCAQLRDSLTKLSLKRVIEQDALWSVRHLQPLADVATQLVYFASLTRLAKLLSQGKPLYQCLTDNDQLQALRGLGVRVRRRIDRLAEASRAEDERIDARALNQGFTRASLETIRQMNQAGLTVFVDKVGNLHGLLLSDKDRDGLTRGQLSIRDLTQDAIAHGSHIDTVNDAGKFDGRLGVLSGLDTLHTLHDLKRYFSVDKAFVGQRRALVTAYIGEEMTFTGNQVSMPGSAAIAGRATPEQVHGMTNAQGHVFKEKLVGMLTDLKQEQQQDSIQLFNDLNACDDSDLLKACSEPQDFYTPNTYERHIEQGPILDRAGVPTALVATIMGIHQEDFLIEGEKAEMAALLLDHQFRRITEHEKASDARITVGIIEGQGEDKCSENIYPALRWTLDGEMNHAGATPTLDRKDPGIAAGRLARYFLNWFNESDLSAEAKQKLRPAIANIRLTPGTNRNVIPGSVSFTTALVSDHEHPRKWVTRAAREDLTQTLEGYVIGTLGRRVETGGEGIRLCRVEPVSYCNSYHRVRLTLDLRCASESENRHCLDEVTAAVQQIEQETGVTIERHVQQQLPPFGLARSGQVLLMERSYGGSHNPQETEMLADILRGSVLQLDATCHFLAQQRGDSISLFDYVDEIMPEQWQSHLSRYTSGALHDTCNIAARAQHSDTI
ncbi:N-carbamoyl-L-amino-acid hydrolase [Saliniradius amylolyticus]|uniref:N-carbamoyl-L-amino-acid hydrolase n=1 Tax=Saliniradius amylolyticus TaxID=2183582 RepID=A0A2S2E3B9_9ALTE|nr:hypothetical protein [Saliniradius amylolyticus]AWL12156.1 N-carbamoyl-L-amino-acid hydrolase [Saliniradius amylolyticus]